MPESVLIPAPVSARNGRPVSRSSASAGVAAGAVWTGERLTRPGYVVRVGGFRRSRDRGLCPGIGCPDALRLGAVVGQCPGGRGHVPRLRDPPEPPAGELVGRPDDQDRGPGQRAVPRDGGDVLLRL